MTLRALIHRDLDAWSAGQAVEVWLRHDRLVVTNPGGPCGITLDRLGNVTWVVAVATWFLGN